MSKHIVNLPVSADLSASSNLHKLVTLTSTGIALLSSATTQYPIGSLERGNDNPAIGQSAVGMAAAVALRGGNAFTFVVVDDTCAALVPGDKLEATATGTVIKSAGTNPVVGIAIEGRALNTGGEIRAILF
jgi:hypothetical protein